MLQRHGYTCINCRCRPNNLSQSDAHHIIPKRKQGLNSLNNKFAVCEKCHGLLELSPYSQKYYIMTTTNSIRDKAEINNTFLNS